MRSIVDLWQNKPDQLLDRVLERAQVLKAAENAAQSLQVDSARLAAAVTVILTQTQTIKSLTAACSVLHEAHAEELERRDGLLATENRERAHIVDELHASRAMLMEKSARIKELELREIQLGAQHLSDLEAMRAALSAQAEIIREQQCCVDAMKASTSWRLTRPLRSVVQQLRSL